MLQVTLQICRQMVEHRGGRPEPPTARPPTAVFSVAGGSVFVLVLVNNKNKHQSTSTAFTRLNVAAAFCPDTDSWRGKHFNLFALLARIFSKTFNSFILSFSLYLHSELFAAIILWIREPVTSSVGKLIEKSIWAEVLQLGGKSVFIHLKKKKKNTISHLRHLIWIIIHRRTYVPLLDYLFICLLFILFFTLAIELISFQRFLHDDLKKVERLNVSLFVFTATFM